jgi:hypothetical protein
VQGVGDEVSEGRGDGCGGALSAAGWTGAPWGSLKVWETKRTQSFAVSSRARWTVLCSLPVARTWPSYVVVARSLGSTLRGLVRSRVCWHRARGLSLAALARPRSPSFMPVCVRSAHGLVSPPALCLDLPRPRGLAGPHAGVRGRRARVSAGPVLWCARCWRTGGLACTNAEVRAGVRYFSVAVLGVAWENMDLWEIALRFSKHPSKLIKILLCSLVRHPIHFLPLFVLLLLPQQTLSRYIMSVPRQSHPLWGVMHY